MITSLKITIRTFDYINKYQSELNKQMHVTKTIQETSLKPAPPVESSSSVEGDVVAALLLGVVVVALDDVESVVLSEVVVEISVVEVEPSVVAVEF